MEAAAPGRTGRWAVLKVPALRRILTAFGISKIGDYLYNTALVVVILERTQSAGWVSAALVAHVLPYSVVAPLAGVLADRMDRRRLMVLSDLGRLLLMLVATAVVAAQGPAWVLVAVAFVSSSVGTPFLSSMIASLPEYVEEDHLAAGNAALQVLMNVGLLAGPVIAAGVLSTGVQWLPFLVNAATFAASATLITGARRGGPAPRATSGAGAENGAGDAGTPPSEPSEPSGAAAESFFGALATGWRAVIHTPVLLTILLIALPMLFGFGMEMVLLPLVSRDLLGTGEAGLGLLTAATGLGGIVGAGIAVRAANSDRIVGAFALACILNVVPLGVLAFVHTPLLAYAVLVLEGIGALAIEVLVATAIQRSLPLDQMGRVDALLTSMAQTALVVGTLITPAVVSALSLTTTLFVVSLVGVVWGVLGLLVGGRQRLVGRDRELVVLLRRITSLDGLEPAAYETLAKAASAVRQVPSGQPLLRAGDPADEVLLLVSGTCDVFAETQDGVRLGQAVLVNQVASPELLGEIGVLHRRPRTATVVATSDCSVRSVPAEAFQAVLSPESALPPALGIAVSARLGRWAG